MSPVGYLTLLALLVTVPADPIFPFQNKELSAGKLKKEHKTHSQDTAVEKLEKLGELSTLAHEVSGEVFVIDEQNLLIKHFNYDGFAPDAFFLVGTEGIPGDTNLSSTAILPYPFNGVHYDYQDTEVPVLGPYADANVHLSLPENVKVSELKWISVWCRNFAVDFGSLVFPQEPEVHCEDYSFDFAFDSGVISAFKISIDNDTNPSPENLPESCKTVEVQECEMMNKKECTEELVEECETNIEEKCENVCNGEQCEDICEEVPIQTCNNTKKIDCSPVPKLVCTDKTTIKCEHESVTNECDPEDSNCSTSSVQPTNAYQSYFDVYRHASYSYLFFPYIQVYKAPNVVRAERNLTANKNYAPGYEDAFPSHETEIPNYDSPTEKVISNLQTKDMNFDFLSKVEGCYPIVMPLMSTISSYFVNVSQSEDNILPQNSSEIDAALFVYEPNLDEYASNYNIYQIMVDWIELINRAMESSHTYKDCQIRKFFGMLGSYFGVSLKKDLEIAKCDIQQSVPQCWQEFKESMENGTLLDAEESEFQYENMTVDSIFFNFDDSTLLVADYNITEVLDYNITDVVYSYSNFESFNEVADTVTEVKDSVYSKLRSGYEKVMKSRSSLGLYFDMYSPTVETVNKLRSYQKERRQFSRQTDNEIPEKSEFETVCHFINSTNVQKCWQLYISEAFSTIDSDFVNSNLAYFDLSIIAFLTQFQINVAIAISIAAAMIFGFRDPMEQTLPCLYDIVANEDLQFDIRGVQHSTSLLQSLVEPFGREEFSTLPIRLLDSTLTVINHEQWQPAFANVTEAAVEKLSEMIEKGELANKVSNRIDDLRDWLMSMDILKLLEGIVDLVKTVLRYRWEFLSGNWSGLTLLMDSLIERIEGDHFWSSLGDIMKSVVVDRWNFVNIMTENYIKPATIWLVTSMEWLAEDVAGNLGSLASTIRNSDGPEHIWSYWRRIDVGIGKHFVCQESVDAEDLLHSVYGFFLTTMTYMEPSFKVFSAKSLCHMFDLCHENEDIELKDIIQGSNVREALIDIHKPILDIKRALMCREKNIERSYWEFILF